MNICSLLWGQPLVAPIYTLLLHKWLLSDSGAGGHEHRQKHLNVLITGTSHFNLKFTLFKNEFQVQGNYFQLIYMPIQRFSCLYMNLS